MAKMEKEKKKDKSKFCLEELLTKASCETLAVHWMLDTVRLRLNGAEMDLSSPHCAFSDAIYDHPPRYCSH